MFYSRCYYILYTSLGFKTVAGLPTFVKCFGEFFLSVHREKKSRISLLLHVDALEVNP